MSASLPERVDAERMVAGRRSFRGSLPVAALKRLAAVLADDRGEVEYALDFGLEAAHTRCLVVQARARLALECQRSLEVFEYPVEVDVRLGLIADEREEASLPGGFEPLLLEGGSLYPARVIEDELLLALPPYPVKPGPLGPDAGAATKSWDGRRWTDAEADVATGPAAHPFAVLGEWNKHKR